MELNKENIITEFNTTIASIVRDQARAAKNIGKVLVMCVYASIEMKDAGMTNGLLKCLRKSMKQQAVKDFIEFYGNICVPKAGDAVYFDAKREWTVDFKAELIKASINWESFKSESAPEALDVEAKLASIVKQVASAQKNNREVKHAELVSKISSLLAEFHAEAFDSL